MGIIQKQAIQGTIFTYIGVVIGFFTAVVVFPNYLETDQIGLLSILVAYSSIFAQFSSFGLNSVTTRMFPYFRNDKNAHNGFLFIVLLISVIGFLIAIIAFLLLKNTIIGNQTDSKLLADYFYYIIPLVLFTLFFNNLDSYYRALYKAVPGTVLKDFVQKIFTLASAFIFAFKLINFPQFILLYVSSICLPTIILTLLIIKDREFNLKPNFKFLHKNLVLSMISVGAFGILASATGVVTLNIDRIMIESFLGLSLTGIYTTTFYFGQLIIMPARSLMKISSTFIANAWREGNIQVIKDIYAKSSINQTIFGIILLIGMWINLDNIFIILNSKFEPGRYVIILIGFAYLFEMVTGVAGPIIGNSKFYRYKSYFMLLQVILVIVTNLIFIPLYGIIGAALASMISKFIYNLIRIYFVQLKFKMHPFNKKFLILVLIGILSFFVGNYLPKFENFIIDIIVRSSLVSVMYFALLLVFNISDDINQRVLKVTRIFIN